MTLHVEEKEMYGRKLLSVTLNLVVDNGKIFAARNPGFHGHNASDEIPLKQAIKIARTLGVEEKVIEILQTQAQEMAEGARQTREHANDHHHSAMRSAGEADALATRILVALQEVTK